MLLKMRLISVLLLFSSAHFSWSSTARDSLRNELSGERDSIRVTDLLYEYGFSFVDQDPDSFIYFNNKAARIAHRHAYTKGIIRELYFLGVDHRLNEDYDSSMLMMDSALNMVLQFDHESELCGHIYHGIGTLHHHRQNYDSALFYLEKSNKYHETYSKRENLAANYNTISTILIHQGHLTEALKFALKPLSIIDSTNVIHAFTYYNISNVHLILEQYKDAMTYLDKGLRLAEKSRSNRLLPALFMNYSKAYIGIQEYDKADIYVQRTLEIYKDRNSSTGMIVCYAALGVICGKQEQLEKAQYWFDKQLVLARSVGHVYYEANALRNLGGIYEIMGNYDRSERSLIESAELYKELGMLIEIPTIYKALSEFAERKGNYPASLKYYKEYITLKDSLYGSEKVKQIADMEKEQALNEKEGVIQLEKQKNQLLKKEREAEKARFYLVMLTVMLLALVGGSILYVRSLRRNNRQIVLQQNAAIERSKKKLIEEDNEILETRMELKTKEITEMALLITEHNNFLRRSRNSCGKAKAISQVICKEQCWIFKIRWPITESKLSY